MKTTYNDIPSGVGVAILGRSREKDVEMAESLLKTMKYLHFFQLDFAGEGKAFSEYILKPVDGGTEVITGFNMETKGIMMKLMSRTLVKKA